MKGRTLSDSAERNVREMGAGMPSLRNIIFISYSHKDSQYLQELQLHLKPLERYADVYWWADTRIIAGTRWREEIREAISKAKVAILLVSEHFLASDFIAQDELPPLLEAAEKREATILPVILRSSLFSRIEELSRYQAINSPDAPLVDLSESQRNKVWVALTERIVDDLLGGKIVLKNSRPRPAWDSALPVPSPVEEREEPPAELEISVTAEPTGSGTALSFNVTAADESLGVRYKLFGPVMLPSSLREFLEPVTRELMRPGGGGEKAALIAQRRLEGIGAELVSQLLPEELRTLLGSLQGRVEKIAIVSDEFVVPWELMRIGPQSGPGQTEPAFLGEAFAISRVPRTPRTRRNFEFRRIAVIAPRLHHDETSEDVDFVLSLKTSDREVIQINGEYLAVLNALSSGSFDTWVIAAHSVRGAGPAEARILLEHHQPLRVADLHGAARALISSEPLVVLSGPSVSDWALPFLRAGAGAVVGSYWPTSGQAHSTLVSEFLRQITTGVTFAQAVKEARLKLKLKQEAPGGSSWLNFTVFAHPRAAVEK